MNRASKTILKSKHELFLHASCIRPLKLNVIRMKKHIILLSLALITVGRLYSQQDPQLTLFMLNPIVYNPALAGTANFYQIRLNSRFQWVGFKDAPITNSVSAYGPHSKLDMGFGGTISVDNTGPVTNTTVNGVYGYNISVQKDLRVSFGLNLGLTQRKVDGTKIQTYSESEEGRPDPFLSSSTIYTSILPDVSTGVYVWNSDYFGGFSALHILNVFSKDPLQNVKGINVLSTTFYLMGGMRKIINREWSIEPTLIAKKVVPAPYKFELSVKGIYKNMLWGGLALRTQDALSVLLGYTMDKKYFFAYAFDLSLTDIRRYNSGSHEIVFGYNFDRIKKGSSKKKKR